MVEKFSEWVNSEGLRFGATNFLSNFIFLSYLLVCPEIVICLAYTTKKCEFWHPCLRGTPIVVLPNLVKFYLFIFAYSEKFDQSRVNGSVFEFWSSCLRGIPSFWYPQVLSNFIFSSYLLILKISCVY